jgi:S1-C subfamily serine protease
MSALSEIAESVTRVATVVTPSIVSVGRNGRGSGIVIADGLVLTNAHNVRGPQVTVTFADGRSTRGDVAGVDADGDLTTIHVDTAGANPITWAEQTNLPIGTPVFAAAGGIGGTVRVTFGLVSSVQRSFRGPGGRRIAGSVEHTAPMAPGSSGSALVDAEGRLVGLNTNRIGEGFYLALPTDAALRARVDGLGRGESPKRHRLGVAIAPGHVARRLRRSVGLPDRAGVLVRGVEDGSAAAAAGIEPGDLIVAAGGRPVTDADDLHDVLGSVESPYEVELVRGAEERTVTVGGAATKPERTPGDA